MKNATERILFAYSEVFVPYYFQQMTEKLMRIMLTSVHALRSFFSEFAEEICGRVDLMAIGALHF